MKRSWLIAIIFFAAALAAGNFVLGPLYCRGTFDIPGFERASVCIAQTGLTRTATALLYFAAVALGMFAGIAANKLPKKPEAAAAQSAAVTEPVEQAAVVPVVTMPAAEIVAAPKAETPAAAVTPVPEAPAKPADAKAVEEPAKPAPAAEAKTEPKVAETKTEPKVEAKPETPPAPLVAPWRQQQQKPFDGTNEELIARFRELAKEGGVEAIATAQRNLDESTLAALGGGTDPKQHLSQIAHLLLMEDPELKSDVARGVVVHIASRLKELGVVPNQTASA